MHKSLPRRRFLQLLGSSGVVLSGCGRNRASAPMPTSTAMPTATPTPFPTATPRVAPTPQSQPQPADIATPVALDVKIGQMFMVGFRGFTIDEKSPIVQDIRERHLGGVVFFDYDTAKRAYARNIQSPEQVRALTTALQAAADIPLLIAIDQEGGRVNRLHPRYGFPSSLSHQELGEQDDLQTTYETAHAIAHTLATVGINQNLAPTVDVNVNPNSPAIGANQRSFSADPHKVFAHARAFIAAHHDLGILCTLKHFPGHGSARTDSHRGLVDVSATWSPTELEPYQRLIDAGLADAIMTAHVFNHAWDAADPATLSPAVINGILRGDLGYHGVVISDDIQMGAIRDHYGFEIALQKTIAAGVDIIAIANNSIYDEEVMARGVAVVKQLVDDGDISEERIDQSYQRIQRLKTALTQ